MTGDSNVKIHQVDRRRRLEAFLCRVAGPAYRVIMLLRCGAVSLSIGGKITRPRDGRVVVHSGDLVGVPETNNCVKQLLYKLREDDFRDYVYLFRNDEYTKLASKYFSLRPQTVMPQNYGNSYGAWIHELQNTSLASHPIRNFIVCSHAHPSGVLFIRLTAADPKKITYEDLERAEKNNELKIENSLVTPRPRNEPVSGGSGTQKTFSVHIKGCSIGNNAEYMKQLKRALGGSRIRVTAPRHLHAMMRHGDHGYSEHLSYKFNIYSRTKLKRKALISSLSSKYTDIDSRRIPGSTWKKWVPKKIHRNANLKILRLFDPVTKRRVKFRILYHYRRQWHNKNWWLVDLSEKPQSKDAKLAAVRKWLEQDSRYSHAKLPMFRRLEYNSMDEFMNGLNWIFMWDSKQSQLKFKSWRHVYELVVPISEPTKKRLILNYYPKKGVKRDPVNELRVSDNRLFSTY